METHVEIADIVLERLLRNCRLCSDKSALVLRVVGMENKTEF
jgi:hypothetical protein